MNAKGVITMNEELQAAQRALLVYMRHLSEDNWCAGWSTGLEFTLWDWVLRRRSSAEPASMFEQGSIPDIETLSWLAEQAGGWWHWDEAATEPRFVAPGEWMEIYRNRPANDRV